MQKKWLALSIGALVLIGVSAWGSPAGEEGAAAEDSMYGGTAALYFWGQDVPSADTNLNQWVTRMYISPVMQRLVEADFVQYGPRGSGEFTNFTSDNISPAYSRGALAESWEVTADRMVFTIRDGITWAADGKDHVMQSRPYTAEDCAYALNRVADRGNAGWRTENGGFIDSIHAEGNDCIVETSSFNPGGFANIAQHSGSVHYPREVVEADPGNWDNLVGTGPFLLQEAVVGSHISFARNPQYWRTTTIDGAEYQLPFIDEMIMPNLPDESTQIASLRTGKLDIMGTVSVKFRDTLADTSPDLQSGGWVEIWPVVVALNHDNEHLANKQVRRALMMAVDQEAIIDAVWGYGALYNYPVDWRDGSRHPGRLQPASRTHHGAVQLQPGQGAADDRGCRLPGRLQAGDRLHAGGHRGHARRHRHHDGRVLRGRGRRAGAQVARAHRAVRADVVAYRLRPVRHQLGVQQPAGKSSGRWRRRTSPTPGTRPTTTTPSSAS